MRIAHSSLRGLVHAFWRDAFARDSIDGRGMHLIASVHYGERVDNAWWDGAQMVYGDGDGVVIAGYTTSIEVIAHELAHGLLHSEWDLVYKGQSGALAESLADVFGSLVKQHAARQNADDADWLIGSRCLRRTSPQRACVRCASRATHTTIPRWAAAIRRSRTCAISCGDARTMAVSTSTAASRIMHSIGSRTRSADVRGTSRATCGTSLALGLHPRCNFASFAKATVAAAAEHGDDVVAAGRDAWDAVGVPPRLRDGHCARR